MALVGGSEGWIRYWKTSGAGFMSVSALRAVLVIFGLSRVVAYSIGSAVPGPWRARQRFQRDAYVGYVRSMLRRRASKAGAARA